MENIVLGQSGLSAPPVMLGGNVFGWTADHAASLAVLDDYAAAGGRLIDTADVYSAWVPGHAGGESETVVGDWLRRSGRTDMIVATKVGMLPGEGGKGLSPARIEAAAHASLQRLGIDTIDLYFAHIDDPETPLEETLGAFDKLVKAGKVRAIGASNYSAERLAEALAVSDREGFARFSVVEPEYNLLSRDGYEGALQDLVVAEDLAAVPYYGLANGYLSGRYRSESDLVHSGRPARIRPLLKGKGPIVLAAMDAVAAETGASLAAIALAWLKAQPGIAAPIASATSTAQLAAIIESLSLPLSADQVARLDEAGR